MNSASQPHASFEVGLSPDRSVGLSLLEDFLPRIPEYRAMRNHDIPGQRMVSGLSPFIRYRLIREREVIEAALAQYSYRESASFIEEVALRTYWKGYLEARPTIWSDYLKQVANLPAQLDDLDLERLDRAREGRSGIDCFDYWVNQLKSTGWLHNHARMWFASIWIFTLRLPWELGAAFFLKHMLDGDPASNTLSWRWVGGLHTAGKHYLASASDIARYTGGMFFPGNQLRESADPLPVDRIHDVYPIGPASFLSESGCPGLSQSPAGLLVCPEELTPELGPLAESPFSAFCIFNAHDVMAVTQASDDVTAFVNGAVEDSASRMASHWEAQVVSVDASLAISPAKATPGHVGMKEKPRIYSGCVDNWVHSIAAWASNEHLKSVWMVQPATGPWKDFMPSLRTSLGARNVQLHEFRNQWDSLHWPHATAGFFKFRKSLRERIEQSLHDQA